MNEMYRGLLVESESEIMTLDWLFELKEKGFIHSIERAQEILISSALVNKYTKKIEMKTKTKEELISQTLLDAHYYTGEFNVLWYAHTPDRLVWPVSQIGLSKCQAPLIGHHFPMTDPDGALTHQNGLITYMEVKPIFDFRDNNRRFSVNQKWVWESRKMFVNLAQPERLFKGTFTPAAYMKTRKKRSERQIKWNIRSVDEYLKLIGYETPISQSLEDRSHTE